VEPHNKRDRGQADGLASGRSGGPSPGADPLGRSDHCDDVGDEDARSARVPLRPSLCGLARTDAKDHSTAGKTRLGKIARAGDEDLRRLLVIGATAVIQQAGAAGGRGTRQQGGPHRLEADGDRGKLRRCADQSRSATHRLTQIGRPRRSRPGRPGAATANGAIGRSTMRNNPWDPLAANRPPGCLELASRKPSWPVIKPIAPNRPDIWMHGGRPHMGPAFAGTTAEATPPRSRSPTPCRPGRSAGRYNRSPAP